MCFSSPKVSTYTPPVPNRQDQANQDAVQQAIRRTKNQDPTSQTVLTGGLGDANYGKNINRVTLLGQTA